MPTNYGENLAGNRPVLAFSMLPTATSVPPCNLCYPSQAMLPNAISVAKCNLCSHLQSLPLPLDAQGSHCGIAIRGRSSDSEASDKAQHEAGIRTCPATGIGHSWHTNIVAPRLQVTPLLPSNHKRDHRSLLKIPSCDVLSTHNLKGRSRFNASAV